MSELAPQRVWQVWRRLLRDDEWREALVSGAWEPRLAGLSPEDCAVVEDYASTPEATRITTTMFRRRTRTVARSSLSLVAPFSKRLLDQTGDDRREEITLAYTRASGYADDGPNFCRTALRFIGVLRDQEEFRAQPGWSDVLALDEASLRLQLRLGLDDAWQGPRASDAGFDPEAGESYDALDGWLMEALDHFELAKTEHDLTAWLQAPGTALGKTALAPGPCHWAVLLANREDSVEYAQITADAARALMALRAPLPPRALAPVLPHLDEEAVLCVLGSLFEAQLVRFVRAPFT